MKKNRSTCFTLLLLFFVLLQNNILYAQFKINGDTTKNEKAGKIIYDKKFLRYFAVLMQDTSLIWNRFSTEFEASDQSQTFKDDFKLYYLPPFIVDSSLFVKCEKMLLDKTNNISFDSQFNDLSKRKYKKVLKNSVHLYMGYINQSNDLIIIISFLHMKMYKKYKNLCQSSIFSMSPAWFAKITFKKGEY